MSSCSPTNNKDLDLESQLAGLDLNQPGVGVLNQRYVPPHMRGGSGGGADFKVGYEGQPQFIQQGVPPQAYQQPPPPGPPGPGGPQPMYQPNPNYAGRGAPRGRGADGAMTRVYNNSGPGRGGYANGNGYQQSQGQPDGGQWNNGYNNYGGGRGGRGGHRGGYQSGNTGGGWSNGYNNGAAAPGANGAPVRNNRWNEEGGNNYRGGSRGYSYAGYNNTSGVSFSGNLEDWKVPLPRDERVESDLFATGNTGINFDKYEDIPVEATGNDCPECINSVSHVYFILGSSSYIFAFQNSYWFYVCCLQFEDITFSEIVRSNIKLARYTHPTPVQVCSIDLV